MISNGPNGRLPDKDLLRTDEVADYLRVSRDTIYRFFNAGTLPFIKIGGQTRVRRIDLIAFCTPENLKELY